MRLVLPLLLSLCCSAVLAQDVHVKVDPAAPQANPGNEDRTVFPTIQNALDHHPWPGKGGRVFIEIAPGTYRERVIVTQLHPNVTLIGKGQRPENVVITNSLNAKQSGGTYFTQTVEVNGDGFQADNLTFENTAGNTGQAVAIVVRADRAIFKHCRFIGHQDTLFADYGRQYYLDSYIEGTVDFIFGNAAAVFDRSELHELLPGYLTAQSRTSADQKTGYVVTNSRVTSDDAGLAGKPFYLGRPWRPYSRVIFIATELPVSLSAAGWDPWGKESNKQTAYYAEFGNKGPGASVLKRPEWIHQLTSAQAKQYFAGAFLRGADGWRPEVEAAKLP